MGRQITLTEMINDCERESKTYSEGKNCRKEKTYRCGDKISGPKYRSNVFLLQSQSDSVSCTSKEQ